MNAGNRKGEKLSGSICGTSHGVTCDIWKSFYMDWTYIYDLMIGDGIA